MRHTVSAMKSKVEAANSKKKAHTEEREVMLCIASCITGCSVQSLVTGSRSDALDKRSAAAVEANNTLISSESQTQQLTMNEQDDQLDQLSVTVSKLRDIGRTMEYELGQRALMLVHKFPHPLQFQESPCEFRAL